MCTKGLQALDQQGPPGVAIQTLVMHATCALHLSLPALHRITANTKKCPNCNIAIEKNQGCMHMICTQVRGGKWW